MLIALWIVFSISVYADENNASKSQLTVPWEEFKKILRIDENEIVLPIETFNKLVAQTGTKVPPSHVIRKGLVVMTREEFKLFVDKMIEPPDSAAIPPFDFLITKAIYSGKMGKTSTTFTVRFQIHVLKKNAYIKIPLLYQSVALEDIKVDNKPALVISENGYYQTVIDKPGEHFAEAVFSVKSNLDQGPYRLDLSILKTPITLLYLELPLPDIDVNIPQAQAVSVDPRAKGTMVSAVISSGSAISVAWRKKAPIQKKLPSKLYAEVNHLLSIEEDALRLNSDIVYSILHSEIDEISLIVPNDWNILGVSGDGVGAWQEKMQGNQHVILVPFTYGRKGTAVVNITAEKPISDNKIANIFTGFSVPNVVRETGYVGVELNTTAEVKAAEANGLERVAVSKLPSILYNKSAKPLIFAYKYIKHPFSLVLDIEKHEKIIVPMASAVSANAVTLFTEDGKVVQRLIYQIRNSEKQFLEIQIPEEADVWNVFVGNEPVESSLSSNGKLLVPLIRSRYSGNKLETFPVEVIYCLSEKSFQLFGWRSVSLPSVDVMTSQIVWSVYVPNDYAYLYFKSSLEKEEIIRGINLLGKRQRFLSYDKSAPAPGSLEPEKREMTAKELYKGKDYKSQFRNVPMDELQEAQQLDAEMNFGGRLEELAQAPTQSVIRSGGAGVLPIQIAIPTTGQVYRFARTIVKPEDELWIETLYARQVLITLVRWIVFILILWIIYLFRKVLHKGLNRLSENWYKIQSSYKKFDRFISETSQSRGAIYILIILTILFWFISKWLSVIVFLLLWLVLIYQIVCHFREKKKVKTKTRGKK